MKRLGELLLERGAIDVNELHTGLEASSRLGGRLGTQLLRFGFVSEKDLLRAGASTPVHQVMTTQVITVTEYTALEEAARVMVDHRISSLPGMRNNRLVGIITETDLFRVFLELLGARQPGVRLTMLVPEEKGMLASVTGEIAAMGGNILALGTFLGEDPTNRMVTLKVTGVAYEKLVAIMEALGMEIVDVREG